MAGDDPGPDPTPSTPRSRRPRRRQVRAHRITVRFSDEEYAQLKANAATAGLAVAAYLAKLGTVPLGAAQGRHRDRAVRDELVASLVGLNRQLRQAGRDVEQALTNLSQAGAGGELTRPVTELLAVAARLVDIVAEVTRVAGK